MPGLPNSDPPIDEQTAASFGIRSGLMLAAAYAIMGKVAHWRACRIELESNVLS